MSTVHIAKVVWGDFESYVPKQQYKTPYRIKSCCIETASKKSHLRLCQAVELNVF
jgi:hypothetical protein